MSIEVDVDHLGHELGEAISALPEYTAFEEAKRTVETDEAAQAKIDEFEGLHRQFLIARQTGNATEDDLHELKQTQMELHSIPVMARYLDAQSTLKARLTAINETISEPLAVDFGEQAGGCCQD